MPCSRYPRIMAYAAFCEGVPSFHAFIAWLVLVLVLALGASGILRMISVAALLPAASLIFPSLKISPFAKALALPWLGFGSSSGSRKRFAFATAARSSMASPRSSNPLEA